MGMQICKIGPDKLHAALELVGETFAKYEVPDYDEMGVETFRHFITYQNMVAKIESGEMRFWGCYMRGYLVGVIALRCRQHVSLLFVRDKFHHLGVASGLLRLAVNEVANEHPRFRAVTVNSSPYAVGFYRKMGFKEMGPEEKKDGIRYTPMKLEF